MREMIKEDIIKNVKVIDTSCVNFTDVTKYEHLVTEDNIWTKAIQAALDENKNVYIPYIGKEIVIDGSIFMDSHTNLKVDKNQHIRLKENSNTYMIRNRNILPGSHAYIDMHNPDEYITVSGGIWSGPGNGKNTLEWACCVSSAMAFSNVKYVNITDVAFDDIRPYSIMMSNCENFYVNNIRFDNCKNDGFHVDGPARYGHISNLSGEGLGDDMVAILAWDWYNCGMTNGNIEKIFVENVVGDNNELRLLTGRRIYPNGTTHDCDIKDCVIENFSGLYTYKMYYQPHCRNVVMKDKNFDRAETVGRMENIYFNNISFPNVKANGFSDIPVLGLFDILADCKNLNFENIKVSDSLDELDAKGVKLINAGPISATWKYGRSTDDWGDFFDPDMCCEVEDIHLDNITFDGEKVTDSSRLVKETHQTINSDYPNTTPAGGKGFGKIKSVEVHG